ncbi:lysophospholipase catalytic domain-containing protein [Scheffersomyces xylosifermentans]|uniref:lysophospholipase catalytic domain-containing protein n=1 Tax=Scheffersomyces xylosifermentans TaxID=1304137 RepID=UPI00315CBCEF
MRLKYIDNANIGWQTILIVFLITIAPVRAFSWPWDSNGSSSDSSNSTSSSASDSSSESASSSATAEGAELYAPYPTKCPDTPLVREAKNISNEESEYISKRQEITNKELIKFLNSTAQLSDFDAEKFITDYSSEHNITIGLAFSGGGYRAMLCGAGELLSLDDRYDGSIEDGLGGLLQSATYLTGLSGGNWLVGSVVLNDWISIADILKGNIDIWNLQDSIFNPSGINVVKTVQYYYNIESSISAKFDAGFDTSITDIWGRALSHQFFPDDDSGENITWSSIRELSSFKNYEMPFPIVVANGRTPGTFIINENSTVFEINPYELGSWDPSLNSFSDVKYIGSYLDNGNPNNSESCIANFDNAGFIMGTSSSLFNQFILRLGTTDLNAAIKTVLNTILGHLSYNHDDIAAYSPNPFYGVDTASVQKIVVNDTLFLVDGGEDSQNVPFYPLIQKARDLDVIFAFDNSADTDKQWPNGTSIVSTYLRQFADQGKGSPFPFVPDVKDYLKQKLNEKPVFFGCDAANLTSLIDYHGVEGLNETDIPLVVQFHNRRYSFNSNTSTFKMSYDDDEFLGLIQNGFEVSSRGNFSEDSQWPTCVGCAIIRRSQERLGIEQSDECKMCFDRYCWKGGIEQAASSNANLNSVLDATQEAETNSQTSSASSETSSSSTTTKHSGGERSQNGWSLLPLLSIAAGMALLA